MVTLNSVCIPSFYGVLLLLVHVGVKARPDLSKHMRFTISDLVKFMTKVDPNKFPQNLDRRFILFRLLSERSLAILQTD
jgi:hypothetical protein